MAALSSTSLAFARSLHGLAFVLFWPSLQRGVAVQGLEIELSVPGLQIADALVTADDPAIAGPATAPADSSRAKPSNSARRVLMGTKPNRRMPLSHPQ
jgi:hypothetical protein